MSAPADPLTDIDRRIVLAYSDLGAARSRFAQEPSGQGVSDCEAAEASLNALLEQRLVHTRALPGSSLSDPGGLCVAG